MHVSWLALYFALINAVRKKSSLRGKEFISFKFHSLNIFHSTYADIPNFFRIKPQVILSTIF